MIREAMFRYDAFLSFFEIAYFRVLLKMICWLIPDKAG